MSVVTGRYFGKEIADLLGLKHTRRIKIDIGVDDFVLVEVEALLAKEDSDKLTGYMQTRRYRLEFIDEDEPINLRDEKGIADVSAVGDTYRQRQVNA